MSKKLSNEKAIDLILKKCIENDIEFIGFKNDKNIYNGCHTKLILKCNKCGTIWNTTSFDNFISKNTKCVMCKNGLIKNNLMLSKEEAINRIEKQCKNKNYEFIGFCNRNGDDIEWDGTNRTYLKLKCNNCGNIWNSTSYNHFMNGRGCNKCTLIKFSKDRQLSQHIAVENILNICKDKNYEFIGFCDRNGNDCEYIGNDKTYLKLKCNKCGNIWKTTNYMHFIGGRGCPNCIPNKKLTIDEVYERIKKQCEIKNCEFICFCNKNGEEIEWCGTYKTYVKLHCNKCDNTWSTRYYCFSKNNGCPNCTISHLEEEIECLLKKTNTDFILHDRKTLDGLELDFYLPKYNFAIECQGEQHFFWNGSDKSFFTKEKVEEIKQRDKIKKQLCEEKGIKLLYYSNLHIDYPYKVYEDKDELLKQILSI